MEPRIAERIGKLKNFDEVRQFEQNATARNLLDTDTERALAARCNALGLEYITQKTGIDPTVCSPAEKQVLEAVSAYVGVMRKAGRHPSRTMAQLRARPILEAAERSVSKSKPTMGYEALADADLEDLSFEAIVLQHPEEFSERAAWYARNTLGRPNAGSKPPADTSGDVQSRTRALLDWLAAGAAARGGLLPQFSNSDVARVLQLAPLSRYGRVLGNIQSRIDFACYRSNLPPLGCAADETFAKAWSQQDRVWAFNVSAMQAVARARRWSPEDFSKVRSAVAELPGQADISWKEEFAIADATLMTWARNFRDENMSPTPEIKRTTNPPWSRDELILALELYLDRRDSPPGPTDATVQSLSEFLNRMRGANTSLATFRNPSGVAMKLMNFRRFDPNFVSEGKVGLRRGNSMEQILWNEFAADLPGLKEACDSIREKLLAPALSFDQLAQALNSIQNMSVPAVIKVRKEAAAIRRYLFGRRSSDTCDVCGKILPVGFLVAAHIKPRWGCDDAEKRDPFVVMKACKLGCDELYERGYIVIEKTGKVSMTRRLTESPKDLFVHASELANRNCDAFRTETKRYFAWHRKRSLFAQKAEQDTNDTDDLTLL